jgi:hypothetical protein
MQKCDITKAAQKELKSHILERLLMCSPGYRVNNSRCIVLRTLFGKLRLDSPRLYHLRMLQQGGARQLQSAYRVTDGANGARVGIPGEQVCGRDCGVMGSPGLCRR